MSTTIEWTDEIWNPVTGCTKVSEGCRHCYAATFHRRFNERPFFEVVCHEDRLEAPLHWRKPRRVFVDSMSDLFHPDVPEAFIDRVFAVMALCPQHTFQVITKRPERMREYLKAAVGRIGDACEGLRRGRGERLVLVPVGHLDPGARWYPLANVWLGVSVENQATANVRIPLLLQTPAAVRFVSCEPLLEPVDLTHVDTTSDSDPGYSALELGPDDEGDLVETLDWVIVGGESGPGARPMHPQWARSVRDQCQRAGVPFFFKQWGEWRAMNELTDQALERRQFRPEHVRWARADGTIAPIGEGRLDQGSVLLARAGKKHAGRLLDGREWNEFPEVRS